MALMTAVFSIRRPRPWIPYTIRMFSTPTKKKRVAPTVSAKKKSSTASNDSVLFNLADAINMMRACSRLTHDETVTVAINLGVDPRRPNQSVRGVAKLPHGSGKTVRVAVFARGAKADEARASGADVVGDQDLADQISGGTINFDRCIATPDMMMVVGKVARVLGPRGLMPNPKLGTVTMDVALAVQNAKQGQVEFKTEKNGIIHAAVGKVSFTTNQLTENIRSIFESVSRAKPSGAKGEYMKHMHLASSMGPGIPVSIRAAPFKDLVS